MCECGLCECVGVVWECGSDLLCCVVHHAWRHGGGRGLLLALQRALVLALLLKEQLQALLLGQVGRITALLMLLMQLLLDLLVLLLLLLLVLLLPGLLLACGPVSGPGALLCNL